MAADLPSIVASHMQTLGKVRRPKVARPDKPTSGPSGKAPGPLRPSGYRTALINGKWVLVPTGLRAGREDPALRPRITVTPIR
jgi:hypothetical protein